MKKYFLLCLAAAFLYGACSYKNAVGLKNEPYPADAVNAIAPRQIQNPSLEPVEIETARNMVKHFKDKQTKKDVGGYLQFDPAELRQLLEQPYVTDVKLVHAAFLDDDTDDRKRNMPTVLVCVTESAGATTYKYYTSSRICPPPSGGCVVEN